MLTRNFLPTLIFGVAMATSALANVVVDMSQIEDYTQYQTDLQQCEGLAVQNQPDAPQRESVAGTAVKGAAVGAAAGAISGGSGSKAAKKVPEQASLWPPGVTVESGVTPAPRRLNKKIRS